MAVNVGQRNVPDTPQNKQLQACTKAKELALHTLAICKNKNVFTEDYKNILTDDIVSTAKDIFIVRAKPCFTLWSFSLIRKTELWKINKPPAVRVVEVASAYSIKPPVL